MPVSSLIGPLKRVCKLIFFGGIVKQEGRGPAILHKLFKKLDLSRGVVVVGEW